MKRLLFGTFLLFSLCLSTASAQGFKAGAAVRIITPDPLLPVSGGIGPRPSTEKRGELTAHVLVLENGSTRMAVVGVANLGWSAALGDKSRELIKGIPPENILIGYYIKRKMKTDHPFLFGLTNDAFGYILIKEDFNSCKRYDYVSRTSLGEMTGDIYVSEVLEWLGELEEKSKLK